jgi:hypothetical protein
MKSLHRLNWVVGLALQKRPLPLHIGVGDRERAALVGLARHRIRMFDRQNHLPIVPLSGDGDLLPKRACKQSLRNHRVHAANDIHDLRDAEAHCDAA